jgi:hypothetical protein
MRARRSVLAAAVTALVLGSADPAAAVPVADFEMPFPCTDVWTGTTRDTHSPSRYALDWNRANDVGDAVVASAPGRVMTAQKVDNGSYGIWVQIDHGNNERTIYAHLSVAYVSVGQRVDQGQMIGRVGSTGNSTGPHMHYEQRRSTTVTPPYFHQVRYVFGRSLASQNCADVPLAGDWDGDGIDQVTVYERSPVANWRIRRKDGTAHIARFAWSTDQPVPGDWDGDGTTNLAARGQDTRIFTQVIPNVGVTRFQLGAVGELPVSGNFGGDARWEAGVWNPSTRVFTLRALDGTLSRVTLGKVGDAPVTGDWDGDGLTDLGVFDPVTAAWTLRRLDRNGIEWLATARFGKAGDMPVPGDWNGDGTTDLGVWTPATATFSQRVVATPGATPKVTTVQWGRPR